MFKFGVSASHALDKGNFLRNPVIRRSQGNTILFEHFFQMKVGNDVCKGFISIGLALRIERLVTSGDYNCIRAANHLLHGAIELNGFFRADVLTDTARLIEDKSACSLLNGRYTGAVFGKSLRDSTGFWTLIDTDTACGAFLRANICWLPREIHSKSFGSGNGFDPAAGPDFDFRVFQHILQFFIHDTNTAAYAFFGGLA